MLALANKLSLTTQPIYKFVNKYSIDFDGVDDYIRISDADSLDEVTTNNFSVSCWVKTTATDGSICIKRDSGTGFELGISSGKVSWYLNDGSGYADTNDTSTINDGEWHHIVWVFVRNDKAYRYIDGVNSGTNDSITSISGSLANSIDLGIGARLKTTPDNFYTGKIDELAIYDRELTQAEITKIYNDGSPINLNLNAGDYQSANPLITSTKSIEFDGTDDYLNISDPTTTDLDFTDGIISCSAWVYLTSHNYGTVLNKGAGYFWYIGTTPTGITQRVFLGNSGGKNSTTGLTINKWHHIAFTSDNSNIKFYLDGKLDGTVSASYTISANTDDLRLGRSGSGEYLEGNLTEVGMYNRTLTALEVASLYNQGVPTNLLVNRNNYQSGNPTVFNTKQVDFDGVDDRLEANSTLGSFTGSVSFWVKRTDSASHQYLIDFRKTSGTGYVYVEDNTGTIFVSSGTVYVDGVAGTTISEDNWHNIVVTGISLNITECIIIGARYTYAQFFNGEMSQVGLWNSTLTADEVSSLYNHGLPIDLTTDQAAYTSSSNLVGYWRMGSGTLDTYPLIADQTNPSLGSELVVNGDFELNSSWLNFGTPTTSEQSTEQSHTGTYSWKIIADATQEGIFSPNNFSLTSGLTYSVSLWIYSVSGNSIKSGLTNTNQSVFTERTVTVGEWTNITYIATASSTGAAYISILSQNSLNFFVDNVSVKQVQGNPAIMTNQTSSDIENGSPYANLVQNGTFDTDSDWNNNVGNDWQIVNGKLVLTTTSFNNINQGGLGLVQNKFYKIVFTITNTTLGGVRIRLGTGSFSSTYTNGTHTLYLQQTTTNDAFRFYSDSSGVFNGEIDNVTVEEVNTGLQGYWKMGDGTNDEYPVIYDQTNPTLGSEIVTNADFANDSDWVKDSGWTIANGKATNDGSSGQIYQELSLEIGKKYVVRGVIDASADAGLSNTAFQIRYNSNAGSITQLLSSSGQILANTINYLYLSFTATETNSLLRVYSEDSVSFYNPTVKEVQGNPATMTNMLEGNITNQYPLTKIRNYYRMGDGIMDGYPIIQDQTSPNLAHIPTTNSFEYSEDFSEWSLVSTTIISGQTSPDNNTNAYKLIPTSSNAIHAIREFSVTGQTFSVTAKKGEYKNLLIWSDASSQGLGVNLDDNSIFRNVGVLHYKITELTDNWKRINVTINASATGTFAFYVYDNSATPQISFAGNDSDGLFIYAAQLEEQSQATAYIKSDGIAAVRKSSTTNLIPYSEDFSGYTIGGITLTSQTETSPINTNDATLVTFTAGGHYLRKDVTVTANTVYTLSFYVKRGTATGLKYRMRDITNNVDILAPTSYYSETSNDWKRIQVTVTTPATCTTLGAYVFSDGGSTGTAFLWGVQLEQQTQAETYAKTTGLPVTIDLFTENNYGTMTNMSASDIVEDTP